MLKQYEIVFILTPVLSDEQLREAVSAYKKLLGELGAKIVHEENWGLKKLAYLIKRKHTGYYHLFQIEAPGESINQLEIVFRRDERILRYLTVFLDKFAIEYAELRKAKRREKKEKREAAVAEVNQS